MKITASDIVAAIGQLPNNRQYNYVNPKTTTRIAISDIVYPEGPIKIRRFDPSKGQGPKDSKEVSISTQMIWRVANAIVQGHPINVDRVVGASYNTRSALEALMVHTPQFYTCYPGRIENIDSSSKIQKGHKHVVWLPDTPHKAGVIESHKTDIVISEVPTAEAIYEALSLPTKEADRSIDIEIQRRHAQIQIALIMIGQHLHYTTWVAQNDKGIVYKGQKIGEMDSVIAKLHEEPLLSSYPEAAKAALLIDCLWFRDKRYMPAVIEIEHSTGVTSGLTRMKKFYDLFPPLQGVRWVIAAPDEDRNKVLQEANHEQFRELNIKFFPYSAIEEIYSLCQRRKLKGITDDFLDCFMEECRT